VLTLGVAFEKVFGDSVGHPRACREGHVDSCLVELFDDPFPQVALYRVLIYEVTDLHVQ
jgi:hypothetical protein